MSATNTPIAMLVFNRPVPTLRVFDAVRAARPSKLLVVADGPRHDRSGEAQLCSETRAIFEKIDWPCEVLTNYAQYNLGCRNRVSSGLKWIFEQVEEAIILEDDCLPDPSFFRFCSDLLDRYRHDSTIGLISGNNFLPHGYTRASASYYYSRFPHIWGWASWRRSFQYYDLTMSNWPMLSSQGWLEDIFNDDIAAVSYWRSLFNRVFRGEIDTWDYQLVYSLWLNGMKSICPSTNLVSNIGFGPDATHTHGTSPYANLPVRAAKFPLIAPISKSIDKLADDYSMSSIFNVPLFKASPRSQSLFRFTTTCAFNKSEEDTRNYFEMILNMAKQALQDGDPTVAAKLAEVCLESGFRTQDLFYVKGLCCLMMNDPLSAKQYFELELSFFPQNNPARELCASL